MTPDDRVRFILRGQRAPRVGPGVRVLWRCPTCGHPWLQDARYPHGCRVRLSEWEATQLALELQTRIDHLPPAPCRICAYQAGGELSIDQYGDGAGFGVSWEGVVPAGTHLLGVVLSVCWLATQSGDPCAGIVTHPQRLQAVLDWLVRLPVLPAEAEMTAEQCALLRQTTTPGHGAAGTAEWVWQGVSGMLFCPPLGDLCLLSLAEATPPAAPWSRHVFQLRWRAVALRALQSRSPEDISTDRDNRAH